MKFNVTLKSPDALSDAICDKLQELREAQADNEDFDQQTAREEMRSVANMWFEYGEYLTIEIDTEARTASVLRVANS